jgi:hypothetical protein
MAINDLIVSLNEFIYIFRADIRHHTYHVWPLGVGEVGVPLLRQTT